MLHLKQSLSQKQLGQFYTIFIRIEMLFQLNSLKFGTLFSWFFVLFCFLLEAQN